MEQRERDTLTVAIDEALDEADHALRLAHRLLDLRDGEDAQLQPPALRVVLPDSPVAARNLQPPRSSF